MTKVDLKNKKSFLYSSKRVGKIRLRVDPVERYYYHISYLEWGDSITLRPRSKGPCRAESEPNIPRICVAPSILLCLCAVSAEANVYRTESPQIAAIPTKVNDSRITSERWLLNPTKFVFLKTIPREVLDTVYNVAKDVSSRNDNIEVVFGSEDPKELRLQNEFKKTLAATFIEMGFDENLQEVEKFSITT